ncbi:MAG: hypothetical protein ABIQ12_04145 [Opitutaceae bacterium]
MKTGIRFLRSLLAAGVLTAAVADGVAAVPTSAVTTVVAAPGISVALRGLLDDALEQGEPLRVMVRIESSGEGSGRVELAPTSGTWADAVAVDLVAAGGGAVMARGTAVGLPASPRATLDRDRVAGGMWIFPGSATQGLALGDYVVRARLALKGGAGWTGEVSSEDAACSIIRVSLDPERVSARTFARAQMAFSQGSFEEAARLLDVVLAKKPDEVELLCLRAEVALAGRNPIAARICVARAARSLSPKTPGPPPPILFDVQQRVLAAPLAGDEASASVPGWTWPPLEVIRVSEKDAAGLLAKTAPAGAAVPAAVSPSAPASPPPAILSPTARQAPAPSAGSSVPTKPASTTASAFTTSPTIAVGSSIGTIVPSADLSEAKILADPSGQWAASATAGSQYGRTQYSAAQATGAPNVPVVGNSPAAWCPAVRDKGMDWLGVTFAKPVRATEVRVRQSDASGAIVKVEAFEPDGTAHVWWEGPDPYKAPAVREIVWFAVRVPATDYAVVKIKLTLNLASGPGYKQIDAVQLVAAP